MVSKGSEMTEIVSNRLDESQRSLKTSILEVNFSNRIVVRGTVATEIKEDVWNDIILTQLGTTWHDPNKDEIEFFIYNDDGTYFCQRKRSRMDFKTGFFYWRSYQYYEASDEEALRIYNIFRDFAEIQRFDRTTTYIEEAQKLFDSQSYFQDKYQKRRRQISLMLLYSDWRMTIDYEEEFEGEQEMWKEWRRRLRRCLPDYETFDNPYEAFKFVSVLKYPIDPNVYFERYPEGKNADGDEVAYLSTDDQYDRLDFIVSKDFVAASMENILDLVNNFADQEVEITLQVKQILDDLNAWDYFPTLRQDLIKVMHDTSS